MYYIVNLGCSAAAKKGNRDTKVFV
jgi:hypothetical protein